MDSNLATPLYIIQDSRYEKQDGWRLDDISLCSSGNIAVSGRLKHQSYVCIYDSVVDISDSRDKPTLLYHKQFTDKLSWRCISFIKPNATEIVTCLYDEVQVIDYHRDVVLRSRKVKGRTTCLAVSKSQIFIGLWWSDIVNIYDNDLNEIKSIRLKGIRGHWPRDIAAADKLYVRTGEYGRAIVYSRDNGNILTEYTTGQNRSEAWSVAVNIQHQKVSVLWELSRSKKQVAVYSYGNNDCLVVFDVEFGVSRIRISDHGRIVTGNVGTGEVKMYELPILRTMTQAGQIKLENKEDDFMSHDHCLMSLPGKSSAPVGICPTKRPQSKMLHSDIKLNIAAKRSKTSLYVDQKELSTTYGEGKFVKEESYSPGVAQPLFKRETAESDSEHKFWTVSPAEAHEKSPGSYTSRKTIITKVGGTLEISDTDILLVIPPNALPADKEEHEIHMRCIPRREVEDEVKCFSSNSTTVVEILPNLRLRHPVRLNLPHCLVLQQNVERKAKIFASHHEEGTDPLWEEQDDVPYHIEDTTCIILLNSFSWYKYFIADEIVLAKKIVVYTAAQKPKPDDGVFRIEVGCYPDLPGQEKDIPGGQNLIVAHKKILYFVKSEKQHPLQISLNGIFPSGWQCRISNKFTDKLSKVIPYSKISEDLGKSCVFLLVNPSNAAALPLCVFTVSQEKDVEVDNVTVQLAINIQVINKVPSTVGVTEYQSSLKAETTITKSGGKLEIPGTGVTLKIPSNALGGNGDSQFVGMRIIPSRIMKDQGAPISSNFCTAVEVYPHTVSLQYPVELRLPHCLTFSENSNLSARISTNYKRGNLVEWKIDTNVEYKLDEKACVIKLNEPCGVKYFIDDTIVKGQKIGVYTAAKKLEQMDEVAELEVGFYPDIPGGGELLRMNPNFAVDSKEKLLFMRKQKSQLQLSLDDIFPSLWECWFPKDEPQDIPVGAIAASIEHSHLFILKKTSREVGNAICTFTTLPKEGPMSLEMVLNVCAELPSLSGPEGQASGFAFQVHEKKLEADSENLTIKLLSRKLTKEWKDVCRSLGLTNAEIFRKEEENKGNVEETIYQCLLHWKQSKGDQATFQALCSALKDNERLDLAKDIGKYEELFPKHNTAP